MTESEFRNRRAKRYRAKVRRRQETKEIKVIMASTVAVALVTGLLIGKLS